MNVLPEKATARNFHTYIPAAESQGVPRYISEAVGMIGKCRDRSEFTIFGLIHTASNAKMIITTVI